MGSAVYEGQVRILVVGQNVGTRRHRRVDSRKAPGVLPALAYYPTQRTNTSISASSRSAGMSWQL